MLAVIGDVFDQIDETVDELRIGVRNISDSRSAEIDVKLQMMKRVGPASHFGIDEGAAGTRADAGDMSVVIDKARRIDVVESAFDQILRLNTDTSG